VSRRPGDIGELQRWLEDQAYLADRALATAVFLALALGQPLLLEGEAGVGKTEVAKALAEALQARLVRLQCYEGIDANQALYEWDYARQLVHLRAVQESHDAAASDVFGERFLLERPLLTAIRAGGEAVLLVDEVDRADEEFEAFLLEVLSDFQVTVPEIGTIRATRRPLVVLTSNRTRELHDALKRRCLYCWIDYPDREREVRIVQVRAPEVDAELAEGVTAASRRIRDLDLVKRPGVAETIAWARALDVLGETLDAGAAATLGAVVKDVDDLHLVQQRLEWVVRGDVADAR
jgi:MoxR-like ATPase